MDQNTTNIETQDDIVVAETVELPSTDAVDQQEKRKKDIIRIVIAVVILACAFIVKTIVGG